MFRSFICGRLLFLCMCWQQLHLSIEVKCVRSCSQNMIKCGNFSFYKTFCSKVAVVTPTILLQRRNVKQGAMAEMIIKARSLLEIFCYQFSPTFILLVLDFVRVKPLKDNPSKNIIKVNVNTS